MGIKYYERNKTFKLDAKDTSYIISVIDEEQFLGHVYFGKKIIDENVNYLLRIDEPPYVPSKNNRDRVSFYDSFPTEYSTHGIGDFRQTAFSVRDINGNTASKLQYVSHKIYKGKKALKGLPSTFGTKDECTSLEIVCTDKNLNLEVVLVYTVFEDLDVITRSVRIVNKGKEIIYITKALSMCIDFDGLDYDMISLNGAWARERHVNRRKVTYGTQSVESVRGETSHQDAPFIALMDSKADDDYGNVYGFNFHSRGLNPPPLDGISF